MLETNRNQTGREKRVFYSEGDVSGGKDRRRDAVEVEQLQKEGIIRHV